MKNYVCILIAITAMLSPQMIWAQSGGVTVPQIIQTLKQQLGPMQSVRGESEETNRETKDFIRVYRNLGATELKEPRSVTHRISWAYKADKQYRQYVETYTPQGQGALHALLSRATTEQFDGSKHYLIYSSTYTGLSKPVVEANFDHRRAGTISPLTFGYQLEGNRWLPDVLSAGDYKIEGTENDPRFGLLYRLSETIKSGLFSQVAGTEYHRLWLAPRYGFMAVRSEGEDELPQSHQVSVYQLDQVEKRGPIWFPVAGTMSFYSVENGKRILLSDDQLHVTRFRINDVPDGFFKPNLPPGSAVKNGETDEFWKIGPHGEKIAIYTGSKDSPGSLLVSWMFVGSITLLLMLRVGSLLRWRKLQKSS